MPEASLVAAAPVSLRLAGNDSANAITLALIKLFTDLNDPVERIQTIKKQLDGLGERLRQVDVAQPTR